MLSQKTQFKFSYEKQIEWVIFVLILKTQLDLFIFIQGTI